MNAIRARALLFLSTTITLLICTLTSIHSLECNRGEFQIEDLKFTDSPYVNRYWHCAADASADIFADVGGKRETWFAFDTASESSKYHGYASNVLKEVANKECAAVNMDARHAVPIHNIESTDADTDTDTESETEPNAVTAKQIAVALKGDVLDFSAHMRTLCALNGFRHPFADYCRESQSMCAIPTTTECLDFFFAPPNKHTTNANAHPNPNPNQNPRPDIDDDTIMQKPCAQLFASVAVRDAFFEWRVERNRTKFAYSGMCFFNKFFICRRATSSSSSSSSARLSHNRIPAVLLPYTLYGKSLYEFAPSFDEDANANGIAFQMAIMKSAHTTNGANRRLLAFQDLSTAAGNSAKADVTFNNPLWVCTLLISKGSVPLTFTEEMGKGILYNVMHNEIRLELYELKSDQTRKERWDPPLKSKTTYLIEFAPQTGTIYIEAETRVHNFKYDVIKLGTEFNISAACDAGFQVALSPAPKKHTVQSVPSRTPTASPLSRAPSAHPSRAPTGHPLAITSEWRLYFSAQHHNAQNPQDVGFGTIEFTPPVGSAPQTVTWHGPTADNEYPFFLLHGLSFTATGNEVVTVELSDDDDYYVYFDNTNDATVNEAWHKPNGEYERSQLATVYYRLDLSGGKAQFFASPSSLPQPPPTSDIDYNSHPTADNRVRFEWDGPTKTMTVVLLGDSTATQQTYSASVVFQNMETPFQMLVNPSEVATIAIIV